MFAKSYIHESEDQLILEPDLKECHAGCCIKSTLSPNALTL